MTNGDFARRYAASGLHVFPLRPQSKQPFAGLGLYSATTDTGLINDWWARWPLANIGCAVGASGLLVPDFDVPTDGFEGAGLLAELTKSYPTTRAQTASGGAHLFYRQPEGLQLGNGRGTLPHGVDSRGHGGYVLLAPSQVTYHGEDAAKRNLPDGYTGAYSWANKLKPAPLPALLLDLLKPEPPRDTEAKAVYRQSVDSFIAARLDAEVLAVRYTPHGGRNERLNLASWRLGKLAGAGRLTESEIASALLPAALDSGLSEREAIKTISRGFAAGKVATR